MIKQSTMKAARPARERRFSGLSRATSTMSSVTIPTAEEMYRSLGVERERGERERGDGEGQREGKEREREVRVEREREREEEEGR